MANKNEVIGMGSHTAIITCKKCGKILATINAYHEPKPNMFVPQDILMEEFGISSRFCQNCLNKTERQGEEE